MKIQFNWGTGIAIFYSAFVLVFILILIKSFSYDRSLVEDNYYEKDLAYQEKFDKVENSMNLETPLSIKLDAKNKVLKLDFPDDLGTVAGKIQLYRPSTKDLDKFYEIATDEKGEMVIPLQSEKKGLWKVRVEWTAGDKDFYDEDAIFL